ncbi:hypothetical protein Kpho01_67800 [Kitasatospora phosalacinea]|uniref:Uncharacterized protein n=1 Tax=Kitasatospora phosalacinea TaxID=2065 RepID=A0A9W6URV9_9ACTN|nr:hypothetical protein Kpho01_67800 [Kitasatospora phosalacinea]
MSPAGESAVPSLRAAWRTLADGLLIQRLHLHVQEWRELVQSSGSLPDLGGVPVAALAARPSHVPGPQAQEVLAGAGLTYWWSLPQLHGVDADPDSGRILGAAEQARQRLVAEGAAQPWAEALRAVCEASAWWVGFFAIIRHRGVRHLTLEPNPEAIRAQVLDSAAGAVAYGMADRLLASALQTRDDVSARGAYCEAVSAGIEIERTLPALLEELGELRLVDLVATTVVWRGQFTKYAGGTGAGQVE